MITNSRVRQRIEIAAFECVIFDDGYEWVPAFRASAPDRLEPWVAVEPGDPRLTQAGNTTARLLVPVELACRSTRRRILGKQDAGIHRAFGALDPDNEASFEKFANDYGLLRGTELVDVTWYDRNHPVFSTDRIADWRNEVRAAGHAIALLDSTRGGRNADEAVLTEICALVNDRLGHSFQLAANTMRSGFRPLLRPTNLAEAIWLRIFQEAVGWIEVLRCRLCGHWFEFDPATVKRDPFLCSAACRSAAYRQRQGQARRLAAQGLSPAAIARRIGSREERIRCWVGHK